MRIEAVEIRNFRKLVAVRLDLATQTTLLVGANNSGKTSALIALRAFLKHGGKRLGTHDLTLSRWEEVNEIGRGWASNPSATPAGTWDRLLPSLDVWLRVEDDEVHRVSALIPTLDWAGGLVGVRFSLEPTDEVAMARAFHDAWNAREAVKDEWRERGSKVPDPTTGESTMAETDSGPRPAGSNSDGPAAGAKASAVDKPHGAKEDPNLVLWPETLIDYFSRHFQTHLTVRHYVLDPSRFQAPQDDRPVVQELPAGAEPLSTDPLQHIVRIDEINAQRGFGGSAEPDGGSSTTRVSDAASLSRQLSDYYVDHLDPTQDPGLEDLDALVTIAAAQSQFDARLKEAFKVALEQMKGLNYPGVTDPSIRVASKLSAAESLKHESAVSFQLDRAGGPATEEVFLPEGLNGLGYQNLISMVFGLMSFRDRWMRVGKAQKRGSTTPIQPIHLVLVEEPEAHLHVQVQQVFAKKAFEVLRDHPDLGGKTQLTTQLVISTHSSHIAHELPFGSLRYFRRLRAGAGGIDVPTSTVINVETTFGTPSETQGFVTRYLRVQHADIFFADALILVEGSAEKMLIPHFIQGRHPDLHRAYVTLLEIGGSHAHRLRPLIDALKISTLVVTDLDPRTTADGNVPTRRGAAQTTGNSTLAKWLDHSLDLDDLLDAEPAVKIKTIDDQYSVRFAYQTPVPVSLAPNRTDEALPSTFEDALAFENIELFRELAGSGLTKKFRDILTNGSDVESVAAKLHDALKTGSKAELALDVMDASKFDQLKTPVYIEEGLAWLEGQVKKTEPALDGGSNA